MRKLFSAFVLLLFIISAKTSMAGLLKNPDTVDSSSNKKFMLYLGQIGGGMPGMNNIDLRPKAVIGFKGELDFKNFINNIDLHALYGDKQTGTGFKTNSMLELRGELTSLYPLYKKKSYESFNVGLYSSFALPFKSETPSTFFPGATYSDEESERISKELLFGADMNFRFTYDKIDSSLHTILFFYGKKIAPNLLAYKPLYKIEWDNRFFLLGTIAKPKLELSTSMQFWFARKAGVALFNMHDGIGGTKREFDYDLKLRYYFLKNMDTYVNAYGFNNLNRGNSSSSPYGFKDGYGFGIEYRF